MSEIQGRGQRRRLLLGSCTMNGLTGRRGPVGRFPGVLAPAAGAAGGGAGRGDGGAALGAVIVGVGAGDAGRAGAKGGRAIGAAGAAGRLGGAAGGAITGRGAAIGGAAGGAARGGGGGAGGAAAAPAPSGLTAKTLLQTLQRARKPPAGTFAGSTRYTVSHDGQVTFTPRPRCLRFLLPRARGRGAGRRQRPIPPASSHSSSFRSPAR